jgi:hypothetical protein
LSAAAILITAFPQSGNDLMFLPELRLFDLTATIENLLPAFFRTRSLASRLAARTPFTTMH